MKNIVEFINRIVKRINYAIEINKYGDFTIAEHFRKQGAQIGEGCFFAIRSLGPEPWLVKIGNNVAVTSGVQFHTHDGGTWIFREEIPDLRLFGPIVIQDNCLIGTNAQILPNVTIGSHSIVAAGSVVIQDVPPNSIVMGVPARRFGSVEKYKEKCIERWQRQKPPGFNLGSIRHYGMLENSEEIVLSMRQHLTSLFSDKLR